MKKALNTIDKMDIFGVPIHLLTNEKAYQFQSKVGGIITLIVGSVSFAYFLYVIVQWINNQIPPNISFQQETIGYAQFELQQSMIELILLDFTSDVDPFRKQNNIITPHLYIITNTTIDNEPIPLFSNEDKPFTISIDNLTLVLNHELYPTFDHQEMKQYLLVLEKCSNNTLKDGSYCADQNVINDYLSQYHGFLFLNIKLKQLNRMTRQLEEFNKQYYTVFDINIPTYSQVMLKQQETIIDDGILFNNYQSFQFINNYELINQQVDPYFASKVVSSMSLSPKNFTNLGCYLFRLDNISIKEHVTIPKLGQVLAQVGSIVQLIFILKHIALFYNKKLLENQLLHQIIIMYYPELKNVKLNILNQCEIKTSSDLNIKYSIQDFKLKYQLLLQRAQEKCRLNNILYEISRIQFIIQQQFGDQALIQSHQLGGKLLNNNLYFENCKESNRLTVKPVNSIDLENEQIIQDPLELLLSNQS
ncbi:unnamed protein product [Paramecium pentaurelia]|uniref:Transmembrane protein n=1 Tax=Paramecium pentaurelia TaxID=43138 RepID=A0A8S1YMA0_9CILI|nr:unnamed protein product [Paramecium pentaurelia]